MYTGLRLALLAPEPATGYSPAFPSVEPHPNRLNFGREIHVSGSDYQGIISDTDLQHGGHIALYAVFSQLGCFSY